LNNVRIKESLSPVEAVERSYATLAALGDPAVFIHLEPLKKALGRASELMQRPMTGRGALFGVPFAVKDNIDVEGLPTSAACPAFRYTAQKTAAAVQRLLDAGAILIGKTNLDQFATGLVGVRSPYGVPRNPFNPAFIPGGSSSGSAVAVATGVVAFALGTDTAGSGRVPAAMNNVVGIKPTRGVISMHGVVPACRAQDCISVFCSEVRAGVHVLQVMAGADPRDPCGRADADAWDPQPVAPGHFRFGVPRAEQLTFRDSSSRDLYLAAAERLIRLGGHQVEVDFTPFSRAAELLYGGPWVAQRLEATRELYERQPEALHPVIREVLSAATQYDALAVFRAEAQLQVLRRASLTTWRSIDALLLPTIPGPVTLAQVEADPIGINTSLGSYTNFVNLLDLCAVAVPAGFGADKVPRGVTLVAPAGSDGLTLGIADALHHASVEQQGNTFEPLTPLQRPNAPAVRIAVAGAHMQGMPLNHQLTSLGARLLERTFTAPSYRFFALATEPPKPGLIRVAAGEKGQRIEVEVWALSQLALGAFVSGLPPPMCLGKVELANGERVTGFLCEPYATVGARDITELGGWRRFVAQSS
jgi:allophanate hydrolase